MPKIDTFWRDVDLKTVERNFHPTMSHIRKALNSNQPLKQNFLAYRDGEYQLNSEFAYRIDTEQFDRFIADGEAARRARAEPGPRRAQRLRARGAGDRPQHPVDQVVRLRVHPNARPAASRP